MQQKNTRNVSVGLYSYVRRRWRWTVVDRRWWSEASRRPSTWGGAAGWCYGRRAGRRRRRRGGSHAGRCWPTTRRPSTLDWGIDRRHCRHTEATSVRVTFYQQTPQRCLPVRQRAWLFKNRSKASNILYLKRMHVTHHTQCYDCFRTSHTYIRLYTINLLILVTKHSLFPTK